ncbi:tyrosine-type recombinase/integrase [Pseudomonas oryzihabitans]|uniref:tyrosine-type recombinase/integrase n=1 Tax=Pseudomonas oryzihabitans TaxID=47885 RepID=UPI0011A7789B|nr:site-specific integrase [Pseudomonas oryzihabitans]
MAEEIVSALKLEKLVKAAKAAGKGASVRVANGLYVSVSKSGAASWIYRYQVNGRRREMGLGSYSLFSLAEAKEMRLKQAKLVALGKDAITERDTAAAAQRAIPTFQEAAEDYIRVNAPGWKNAKHLQQWENTLATYAYPVIGVMPVDQVRADQVAKVLAPIWTEKRETASRLRGRIESVLERARSLDQRSGDNPASKGRMEAALGAQGSRRRAIVHRPALPWEQVPEFMAELSNVQGLSARALELTILTACRTGEVLGARWDEMDLDAGLWVIPEERMKMQREHRVPLSAQAVALVRQLPRLKGSAHLFPGRGGRGHLSGMAMLMQLRRLDRTDITTHGFRSSFRDWSSEATHFPNAVCEAALAHQVKNAVEAAYRRGDLLAKRRELMQAWGDFCAGEG